MSVMRACMPLKKNGPTPADADVSTCDLAHYSPEACLMALLWCCELVSCWTLI